MNKPLIVAIFVLVISSFGVYFLLYSSNSESNESQIGLVGQGSKSTSLSAQELQSYKTNFANMFLNYQNSDYDIPKKGIYDFTVELKAGGDEKKIKNFLGLDQLYGDEVFSNLSLNFYGDYDFNDHENIKLNANVKVYLNKLASGLGDIDISMQSQGLDYKYQLNNLNPEILNFFGVKGYDYDMIMGFYNENKGVDIDHIVTNGIVESIIMGLEQTQSPLYENTSKEEKLIAKAFVDSNSVDIVGGEHGDKGQSIVNFKIDNENLIGFLESVGEIIGTPVDYGYPDELSDQLNMGGYLEIKDDLLINSDIFTEIPVSYVNQNSEQKSKVMIIESKIKMPSATKVNFDLDNYLYQPDNKQNYINIRIKGLIK